MLLRIFSFPFYIFLMIYDWNISDAGNIASPFKVGWLPSKGKNVDKHTEVFPSIEFVFRLFISYQFEISFAVSNSSHGHPLIERIKDRTTAVCIHWGITSYTEWQGNLNFIPIHNISPLPSFFYYENILMLLLMYRMDTPRWCGWDEDSIYGVMASEWKWINEIIIVR